MINELLSILKLDEDKLSSVNFFLKILAEYSGSSGIIVWEHNKKTNYLTPIAHYFKNGQEPPLRILPIEESLSGKSIISTKTEYKKNILDKEDFYYNTSFWVKLNINSFFVVPIIFKDGDAGTLNFYSNQVDGFSEELRKDMETLAQIFPDWYDGLQSQAINSLLNKINFIFKKIESKNYIEDLPSKEVMSNSFKNICDLISETLNSFETSIFLNDSYNSQNEFECIASTWASTYKNNNIYKADETGGLTAWILFKKEPVHIIDLDFFNHPKEIGIIHKEYPNIRWNALSNIKQAISDHWDSRKIGNTDSHPIGFLGVPIFFGEKLLGVIRTCAIKDSPYFFGSRKLAILESVAIRIGEIWENWSQNRINKNSSLTFQKIISTTNSLDALVLKEIKEVNPSVKFIFKSVLSILQTLIIDAEILDIRLFDPHKKELYFYETFGDAWHEGSDAEKKKRIEKRFSTEGDVPQSAGAEVFRSGQPKLLDPIKKEDHYDGTFIQVTKMIVAPLLIGDNVLGVLDVRSTKKRPFESTALHAVELMGGQLAVYQELINSVIQFRKLQNDEIQTFQDFAHQIKNPIYLACNRARLAIKDSLKNKNISLSLMKNINATSGLCNKANRVAKNIFIFSTLAKKEKINLNLMPISGTTLYKLIVESVDDNRSLINPDRKINFSFKKDSLEIPNNIIWEVDYDMLEQIINVLIDNAVKYSYENTVISIWGLCEKNNFQITIRNKGIPITTEETIFCIARGWRSKSAIMTTGEGGGIGLWIVESIMKAHGATLVVNSTNKSGYTDIQLNFRTKKK